MSITVTAPLSPHARQPAPHTAHAKWPSSKATRTHPHTVIAETRRPYATHLIEDGWDAKFVQDQMGHDHASTTSLYTCVSSDYRVSTLRAVLDTTITTALSLEQES